jgi:hypothetical protein
LARSTEVVLRPVLRDLLVASASPLDAAAFVNLQVFALDVVERQIATRLEALSTSGGAERQNGTGRNQQQTFS